MNIEDKIKNGLLTLADQEEALKNPVHARLFAFWVPGANIEKCQEAACRNPRETFCFAIDIPEADINKCIEACKGTEYEDKLNTYLMEKALI